MKWLIVGLFGLGLAAAVCAAVLVVSFNDEGGSSGTSERAVLVASRDLDALTELDQGGVTVRQVPLATFPAGALSDPVQAVGRVLLSSVRAGQPLTDASFVGDASAARLAASLQPGFRAVNVHLNDTMSLERLLTPGCVVDVLASIQMQTRTLDGERTEPVSITLLQGVRVLAVGDLSVVSPAGGEAENEGAAMRERPSVTLLVNAQQAEKLKLAMQEGSVTLTLRNPKDAAFADVMGTGLASLSPIFAYRYEPTPLPKASEPPPVAAAPVAPMMPVSWEQPWETVVLRGGVAETRQFSRHESSQNH